MASFILGERPAAQIKNSETSGSEGVAFESFAGRSSTKRGNHVFNVSTQLNCLKRALRVISNTTSNYGPDSILLIGKSPEKISGILRFSNPYEEILKNTAIASGALLFAGDSQT